MQGAVINSPNCISITHLLLISRKLGYKYYSLTIAVHVGGVFE